MGVDRLLSILLILSSRGLVTGKGLAEHFEVSLRTIYRDIDKLCEAGVPIASEGGNGGGFYLMEGYAIDRLFFNKSEMKTFSSMLKNLNVLFGKNSQFNGILLKFENASMTDKEEERLLIDLSHLSMEEELKKYLYLINKSIEESNLIEFTYINRRMEQSYRIAEPVQLTFTGGAWNIIAFCRDRNAYRKFKLLRIRDLKLGDHFIKRMESNEEISRIFEDSFKKNGIMVKLKFTDKIGEQLKEYFDKAIIIQQKDGSYIVEELYPYEEGLIKFILGFGLDCEVLCPDFLREDIKKYIEKLVIRYNG
jgi:predicted DNA-binding transcriptional regulator YafY